jgi:hypothetical protein
MAELAVDGLGDQLPVGEVADGVVAAGRVTLEQQSVVLQVMVGRLGEQQRQGLAVGGGQDQVFGG